MEFREFSEEELTQILDAHENWLTSGGAEGARADFSGANLKSAHFEGANLREGIFENANLADANFETANLERANLFRANLQGARLFRANLQGARLNGADLSNANLVQADLKRARLNGADLQRALLDQADLEGAALRLVNIRNATLTNANLDGVIGLLGSEFQRANVTGTRLPIDIREFKVLEVVDVLSKNARFVFLTMLLLNAYFWLTIGTTTDPKLLTNSASFPLPIINVEIPIGWFYWVAPFILVGIFIYFHFYLDRLWQAFSGLPAIFPDGKRLDERTYPWLLNGIVRRHFDLLKEGRSSISKLEEDIAIFLAWWLVPTTLAVFWIRYLPRHDWFGTGIHIALLMLAVINAVIFYRSAAHQLKGVLPQPVCWKKIWRDSRFYLSIGITSVGLIFLVLSFGAINGMRSNLGVSDFRTWVPWAFERIGYLPFAEFRELEISIKPANYWSVARHERIELVKGAYLPGVNLRYADAFRAYLVNADLRDADLGGANLKHANLERANFNSADLRGVDLSHANLEGANLRFSNLEGANLFGANLKGATLVESNLKNAVVVGANFENVNFVSANLEGTNFSEANLSEVDFSYANLAGSNLVRATGLKRNQIIVGCLDADTKIPLELSPVPIYPCPDDEER